MADVSCHPRRRLLPDDGEPGGGAESCDWCGRPSDGLPPLDAASADLASWHAAYAAKVAQCNLVYYHYSCIYSHTRSLVSWKRPDLRLALAQHIERHSGMAVSVVPRR